MDSMHVETQALSLQHMERDNAQLRQTDMKNITSLTAITSNYLLNLALNESSVVSTIIHPETVQTLS